MDAILPAPVHAAIGEGIEFIYTLEKYVTPTVVLVPSVIEGPVQDLSEAIGFDVDTLKYTLAMFLCYPLGLLMNLVPYGKAKHAFSFFFGVFLLQFTVGSQWIHQFITSMFCYVMFMILPAKTCKTIVPVFLMLYMTATHLHRQFINYLGWDMDYTSMQMVITIKLYSLAYNLYDGELIAAGKEDRAAKKCAKFAVTKLPSLIEYLGFTFCFSNILCGPAVEYSIYAAACDGSLLYDKDGKPKGKIPSNIIPTLWPLFKSLLLLGIFVVGSGYFPLLDPVDPQNNTPVVITEEFLKNPWWYRYMYMWISLFPFRSKYYFGWANAEGAINSWYAGFEGFDEEGKAKGWSNSINVNIIGFETAPDVRTLSSEWNMKTQNWLARYVYMRTGGSLVATYGLSAFWHGFYPGYYMFFFTIPLYTTCEREIRKKISPHFANHTSRFSPYYILCTLVTSFFIMYAVVTFPLLALEWSWACWKSNYFVGHILAIAFLIFMKNFVKAPKKKEV
mmetsp:Transcript_27919/g.42954  ORF Transcript_27919/g.42954 Transcript_27919/m.42954 type:complete len:504 (+) Transcript_27919:84-1595(+)